MDIGGLNQGARGRRGGGGVVADKEGRPHSRGSSGGGCLFTGDDLEGRYINE